ncbi:MAG: hypothetical protein WA211_04265 [Candidatus Acidiferrales bacterium]
MRRTLEISGILLALLLAAMAIHAAMAEHEDRLRMQATIAAQKQLLDAADTRERDRAAALKDTLTQIEALKRSVQTPAEILRDLPKYLPLPQPITMTPTAGGGLVTQQGSAASEVSACATAGAGSSRSGGAPAPTASTEATSQDPLHFSAGSETGSRQLSDAPVPAAQIPAVDLKPLYDYVQDCRACQAQLAAAKQNSADDAAKLSALTRERDSALTAAKGGTFWRRLRRNALWFALGAGVGAVAACGTGHCR